MNRRGPARPAAVALLIATLALVAFAAGAPPASAHAVLLGSSPTDGEVLTERPGEVVLRFNEPVDLPPGAIVVLDPAEARWDEGAPGRVDDDRRTARVALGDLPAGTYLVSWQVISADGHPLRGSFTFRYDPPAPEPEPEPEPEPAPPAGDPGAPATGLDDPAIELDDDALAALEARARAGADTSVGVLAGLSRFAVYAGTLLLVGSVAFLVALWPAGRAARRSWHLVWGAWAATVAGSIGIVAMNGPAMVAGGLSDVLDVELLRATLETRSGSFWGARLLLLVLAAPLLHTLQARDPQDDLPLWWWGVATAVGAGLLAVPALSGHAVSGRWVRLAVPADIVHLGAAAVWLGGLTLLGAVALRVERGDEARALLVRFSTLATWCIAAVVATGAFQSWRQVGSLDGLTSTAYGRLLLAKLAVFAGVLAVAAYNNRRVRRLAPAAPRREPLPVSAAPAGSAAASTPGEEAVRRAAWLEVGLAVGVLAVTAALVNAVPARAEAALPVERTLRAEEVVVDLVVIPARTGVNELHFYALEPRGGPLDVEALTATIDLPAEGLGPLDVPISPIPLGPGHYMARAAEIPEAGTWRLEVTVELRTGEVVRLRTDLPVRR